MPTFPSCWTHTARKKQSSVVYLSFLYLVNKEGRGGWTFLTLSAVFPVLLPAGGEGGREGVEGEHRMHSKWRNSNLEVKRSA